EFAKESDGTVDQSLAASYAKAFQPGIDEAVKGVGAPGMFWPCEVELAEIVPDGVQGRVLLRSSPLALDTSPPQHLNPFGRARLPQQQQADFLKFYNGIKGRLASEPRRQYGLMVELNGEFSSFFEGKKAPMSPAAKKAEEERKALTGEGADEKEEGADEPAPDVGPEPAAEDEENLVKDPAPILASTKPGRLIVVGDASFLRDDIAANQYARMGGPVSFPSGARFLVNLLDWLASDQDLFELRNKIGSDRTLRLFGDDEKGGDLQRYNERVRDKEFWLRTINIALPCGLLLVFGLVVFVRRRTAKRAFLENLGS
ncbi:MAG: hypothetical protein KDB80_08995, partial [Planctomycetes bacterium]|nr:hypothetical protein [Planctomycetota bacterium]